jgi:hypothetical protein
VAWFAPSAAPRTLDMKGIMVTHTDAATSPKTSVPLRGVRVLVAVQSYVLAAYLAAAIIPYLWQPREYPPTWLWIVPGWLLGVPGFYIAVLGPVLAVPLALLGAVVAVRARGAVPARLFAWCAASAVTMAGYAVFTLTPFGQHLASFVAD